MKKLHLSMAGRRARNGYLFILPWFLGFVLFYLRSLFMTVQLSLEITEFMELAVFYLLLKMKSVQVLAQDIVLVSVSQKHQMLSQLSFQRKQE